MSKAPQIKAICVYAFSILLDACRDGEPKTGKHKFSITLCGVMIGISILWWGGFWTPLFR
jgi:hypothetical protein